MYYPEYCSGELTKTETSVEKNIQKNHGNIGQFIKRVEESWRLTEALRRFFCSFARKVIKMVSSTVEMHMFR